MFDVCQAVKKLNYNHPQWPHLEIMDVTPLSISVSICIYSHPPPTTVCSGFIIFISLQVSSDLKLIKIFLGYLTMVV